MTSDTTLPDSLHSSVVLPFTDIDPLARLAPQLALPPPRGAVGVAAEGSGWLLARSIGSG